MKYLLDTNVCIRYINGRSPNVRNKLASVPRANVCVSIITVAELYYGSAKSQSPQKSRQKQQEFLQPIQTVLFDEQAAVLYGEVRSHLSRQGTPIGANDLLIASTALAHQLTLITHNVREFERVPGLSLEDWETS